MVWRTSRRTCVFGVLICLVATGADWTGFRGPAGSGVSAERDLPIRWSATENVAWKTKLPGPGTSSPIVVGDRVFVTCFTGYGIEKGGDTKNLRRQLLCLSRANGDLVWRTEIIPKLPESRLSSQTAEHGYASSTPATDGERIYVFFGRTGVVAFDLQGKQLWQTEVGTSLSGWGSASSPVLHKNLVIVNAAVENNAVVALDKRSGQEVWRKRGLSDCWTTPVLVEVPGGKSELVVHVPGALWAFEPETGVKLWECGGVSSATASSSPVARAGIVYVMGAGVGNSRNVMAVRAGGKGDVSQSHVIWKQKAGANHSSPLVYGDYLYYVSGQVCCLRADTGDIVYQERLYSAGTEYSSPVAADGKLFAFTRRNGAFVLAANGKFELLAHNELGDASVFNASPAIDRGQLLIRSNEYLYCLGKSR